MKPARQLELMIAELQRVEVEDLARRDWLSVLLVLKVLVRGVDQLGGRDSFGVLIDAVKRAQRSGLPVPPRNTSDPDRS